VRQFHMPAGLFGQLFRQIRCPRTRFDRHAADLADPTGQRRHFTPVVGNRPVGQHTTLTVQQADLQLVLVIIDSDEQGGHGRMSHRSLLLLYLSRPTRPSSYQYTEQRAFFIPI